LFLLTARSTFTRGVLKEGGTLGGINPRLLGRLNGNGVEVAVGPVVEASVQ